MEQGSPLWGFGGNDLILPLLNNGGEVRELGIRYVQFCYPGNANGAESTRVNFSTLIIDSDFTCRDSTMGFFPGSLNSDEAALMLNLFADLNQKPIDNIPTWIRTEDNYGHPLRLLHVSAPTEGTLTVNIQLNNLLSPLLDAFEIGQFPLDTSLANPRSGINQLVPFLVNHISIPPEIVTTTLGTMTEKDLIRICKDDLMPDVMPWLRHDVSITDEMRLKAARIQAIRNIVWSLGDQLVYREPAWGSTDWDRTKNWPVPRDV